MSDSSSFANPLAPDWLEVPANLNALNSAVWSRNSVRSSHGEIVIAGVAASTLVEEFGTPVYVIDEADVRSRALEIREAFEAQFTAIGSSAKIYYAGKAFLSTEIAAWMIADGLNIDVCSGGELAVALAAGAPAERLGLHGNNKSVVEIDRAVRAGIGAIVLDSVVEIERVAAAASRHGRTQAVRLRVNSGVRAHTHEYLATAREDQKFGIPLAEVTSIVALIRSHDSLKFLGLHSHIGSQIFEVDGFAEAAARLFAVHAELLVGGPVPELNLGGGFGIAYTAADNAPQVAQIAGRLAEIVANAAAALKIPVPVIAIEPGRSIVGPSTTTLYTVGTAKDVVVDGTATRTYLSIDGGMSDNVRPSLYGANYSVSLANRASGAPPQLVRVAGKHCESGDVVVHADYLPNDVVPGDILGVPATGAYGWAMASNYNYLGRPPVVAVRDGVARLIVRRENEDDLLSRDMGIVRSRVAAADNISFPQLATQETETA
ncbi:MAG: diaminopimelate decarboxylase [Microbacteriaceae bacterium]